MNNKISASAVQFWMSRSVTDAQLTWLATEISETFIGKLFQKSVANTVAAVTSAMWLY